MELYKFFWGLLAWSAVWTVPVFANWPMLALAYKIQHGPKPLDEDQSDELWYRAFMAALGLGAVTAGFILADYLLTDWLDLPPGPIHLFAFIAYVPAGAWMLFHCFGYTDLLDGFSVFVIDLAIPLTALFVFNALTGLLKVPLDYAYSWLGSP